MRSCRVVSGDSVCAAIAFFLLSGVYSVDSRPQTAVIVAVVGWVLPARENLYAISFYAGRTQPTDTGKIKQSGTVHIAKLV